MRREDQITEWLEETGLPYALEPGGHHLKIKLAGRLVGILPRAGKAATSERGRKALLSTRAQIRRAARELSK